MQQPDAPALACLAKATLATVNCFMFQCSLVAFHKVTVAQGAMPRYGSLAYLTWMVHCRNPASFSLLLNNQIFSKQP